MQKLIFLTLLAVCFCGLDIASCINKKHQSLIKDSQQLFLIFFYYSFKISLNLKWAETLISSAILLLTKLGISMLKSSGFIVKVV